jgi:phosphoserine phosphatase
MKYITVKLTEDQINTITQRLMQRLEDDTEESMAFRWRLVKALKNARDNG